MDQPQGTFSSTRLYLGNLPRSITKQEVEDHFSSDVGGTIKEIQLMNGFGFIEFDDMMDARDAVRVCHGSEFKGERLTVNFARDQFFERDELILLSTRLYLGNLPQNITKQEVGDHFSGAGTITEIKLMNGFGFIDFDNEMDALHIVRAFNGSELKGKRLTVNFVRGPKRKDDFRPEDRQVSHPQNGPKGEKEGKVD